MPDFSSVYRQIIASVLSSEPAEPDSPEAAFGQVIEGSTAAWGTPESALKALNQWEQECYAALARYRNLFTHNMILFLADDLNSSGGGLEKITGGFAHHLADHAVANLGAIGVEKIGEHTGGHLVAKYLLQKGTARVFGGIVGFVIGVVVETAIAHLLQKTKELVDHTAQQIDGLVTQVVNPVVDREQRDVTVAVQRLRDDLTKESLSADELKVIRLDLIIATSKLKALWPDPNDEHDYRLMALMANVYSRTSVPAELSAPITLTGAGNDIGFTMAAAEVKTGQTSINVTGNGGIVVVRFRAYDCVNDDGEYSEVDIYASDAPAIWKSFPPPREYSVLLYQITVPGVVEPTVGVPRVFDVGVEQYGVWFNLPAGVYYVTAQRSDPNPNVSLCAKGKYWVKTAL